MRRTRGSGCWRRTSGSRARWTPSWTRRTGWGCRRWSCWGGWARRAGGGRGWARRRAGPGRRAGAEWPRLSALARETGLSLSRVSRHMDALERRGLVQRRRCSTDSRAVEASLTDAGRRVVAEAEAAHAAAVRERFLSQLSDEEAAVLARVFRRFAPRAADACAVVAPGQTVGGGGA